MSEVTQKPGSNPGIIEFAKQVIGSLLIFNGGAIVALLTLYGNLLAKASDASVTIPSLTTSITPFAIGVIAGLICAILAYFSQSLYKSGTPSKRYKITYWSGVFVALVSLFAFAYGAWHALSTIKI